MSLKERILELLGQPDYTPLKSPEIFDRIEAKYIPQSAKQEFDRSIKELLDHGEVVMVKNDRLCLPRDADLLAGRIHFRQSGTALVFPEDGSEPIGIPAEETGVAMHGDTVLLRLVPANNQRRYRMGPRGRAIFADQERLGKVIRILMRARTKITGTLAREKNFYHVIPDDPRIIRNILVADPKAHPLSSAQGPGIPKVGDKVVIELGEWKQKHLNPEGKIVGILGRSHEPKTEHAAIFVQYSLEKDFPVEVEAEARKVSIPVTNEQREGRLDLRAMPVFTIDPDDAKDFDDALHMERLEGGRLRVGIHIADVSAYVKTGGALDREAQRRGNSTYLVGEVVPMLPHALSSGVCSLKEGEDRLTKSVLVTFDPRGEIERTEYANTVIRSIKRLSYKQAKIFLDEDDFEKIRNTPPPPAHLTGFPGKPLKTLNNNEMRTLQSHIRQLWSLARRLRSKRMRAGSLDLDMPESKIYLDAKGYPERIVRVEHDESHQLVEEFMLLANEAVAKAFNRQHIAAIHRVHDMPDAAKLDELRETLITMGIRVGDMSSKREVAKFLEMTQSHPKGVYLRGLFLRSLKQACYRASPDGHYGLAMQDYAHFTSPIRRYADFIVHRIFDGYLYRNALPTAPKTPPPTYNVGSLQQIAAHISLTEQNSTEAERQSVKNRLLEFFELETKKTPKNRFEAVITDVKNHGVFVELTESMAWGFIHVSTLQSDFYVLSDDGQALVGRKTQRRLAIGDKVLVEVEKVDRFKRQMDFAFAKESDRTLPPIPAQQVQREKLSQQRRQVRLRREERKAKHRRGENPAAKTRYPFKKRHSGGSSGKKQQG